MGPRGRSRALNDARPFRALRLALVLSFASALPAAATGCSQGSPAVAIVVTSASTAAPALPPASASATPRAHVLASANGASSAAPSASSSVVAAPSAGASGAATPTTLPEGYVVPPEAPVTDACPADMALIEGSFCTEVTQTCDKKRHPWQCAEFAKPTVCTGKEEPRRYCIDRYEYPNKKGELPVVMQSWYDAERQCKAEHKRLCKDSEWTLACEGPERLPFPYGYVRNAQLCPIDKPSPKVNEKRLFSKKHGAEELARLDQRERSGERAGCVSPYGVHDLTGNVDEWVVNESGHPYSSSLKGGNWGEYRNACRPATRGHAEGFRYYQMGFRCCADAKAP